MKNTIILILAIASIATAGATQHNPRHAERLRPHHNADGEKHRRHNVPETGATLPLLAMGLGALFIVGRNQGKTVRGL